MKPPATVESLFQNAFFVPRDSRSEEYKAGVRAILNHRINGLRTICPYDLGTAAADAFLSGTDEGHSIWRRHLEELQ